MNTGDNSLGVKETISPQTQNVEGGQTPNKDTIPNNNNNQNNGTVENNNENKSVKEMEDYVSYLRELEKNPEKLKEVKPLLDIIKKRDEETEEYKKAIEKQEKEKSLTQEELQKDYERKVFNVVGGLKKQGQDFFKQKEMFEDLDKFAVGIVSCSKTMENKSDLLGGLKLFRDVITTMGNKIVDYSQKEMSQQQQPQIIPKNDTIEQLIRHAQNGMTRTNQPRQKPMINQFSQKTDILNNPVGLNRTIQQQQPQQQTQPQQAPTPLQPQQLLNSNKRKLVFDEIFSQRPNEDNMMGTIQQQQQQYQYDSLHPMEQQRMVGVSNASKRQFFGNRNDEEQSSKHLLIKNTMGDEFLKSHLEKYQLGN